MPADDPATPVSPQVPAPHRPAPTPRPVITPADARRRPSAAGRVLRGLGVLLLIGVLAAVIAGVVLLITDAGQDTDVGQFLQDLPDELPDLIDRVEDFIRDNTQ
jgi:hypothetical protein